MRPSSIVRSVRLNFHRSPLLYELDLESLLQGLNELRVILLQLRVSIDDKTMAVLVVLEVEMGA